MILTNKQEEGLKIAVERYRAGEPWTCIAGYAGTGKSTLIKFIISALNLEPHKDVAYVAFTGKAASVLRNKGCPNASTAHKLLYYSKKLPDGKFTFTPKSVLENKYKLIVVDEISMLPLELWKLLLSHKVHVLACGDPF
jgi:exodeoxyribonuclease-5